MDEVEKSKAGNLGDLLQPGLDLDLAGVLQADLEPLQDGFLLVLTSTDDEREAEAIAISKFLIIGNLEKTFNNVFHEE